VLVTAFLLCVYVGVEVAFGGFVHTFFGRGCPQI
jgi:hypothetical protein